MKHIGTAVVSVEAQIESIKRQGAPAAKGQKRRLDNTKNVYGTLPSPSDIMKDVRRKSTRSHR